MDVISATSIPSSSLNPHAPMFVPMAYRTVEDFSDEWWSLVHSSPWFRDYWLGERFNDDELSDSDVYDHAPFLFDDDEEDFFADDQIDLLTLTINNEKALRKTGGLKWNKSVAQVPKYAEKAPKIVNVKVSPRAIQQPR
ncbi:hypothetical protein ACFE04_018310 [Oxalis oulophora]